MSNCPPVLAIILGRAGSKGLPGKNELTLDGKSMVSYSIDHAKQARSVTHIAVSTDSKPMAETARAMGVSVIDRPAELADDHATVDAAARHAARECESNSNTSWPIVVILYANVPVRPVDLIDRAVQRLIETNADSVQSYCSVGKYHPDWMVQLHGDGRVKAYSENTIYRRQDLPPLHLPDGGVIAVTHDSLFTVDPAQPHAFLGNDRRGIEVPPGEVIDIDSDIDLAVAQAKLATLQG